MSSRRLRRFTQTKDRLVNGSRSAKADAAENADKDSFLIALQSNDIAAVLAGINKKKDVNYTKKYIGLAS